MRVAPHGRPDAARGVQPGLRGLDGETPSCAGLCGGRTRLPSPCIFLDSRATCLLFLLHDFTEEEWVPSNCCRGARVQGIECPGNGRLTSRRVYCNYFVITLGSGG